jgi:hypothetical protein
MLGVVKYFGNDIDWLKSRELWIAVSALFVFPLAFLPTLDKLRFTSALALVSVVYLVCIVVAQYALALADGTQAPPEALCLLNVDVRFFKVMTIFVFGFTCHQNVRPAPPPPPLNTHTHTHTHTHTLLHHHDEEACRGGVSAYLYVRMRANVKAGNVCVCVC